MTSRPSRSGRIAAAPPARGARAIRASSSSMRRASVSAFRWLRVVQSQRVSSISSSSRSPGVADEPPDGRVGPAHLVGVEPEVQVHEQRDVARPARWSSAAPSSGRASCARRPPRGGGTTRPSVRSTASWACPRRGAARPAGPSSWADGRPRPRLGDHRDGVGQHVLVAVDRILLDPHRRAARGGTRRPDRCRPGTTSPPIGSSTMSSLSSSSRMRSADTMSRRGAMSTTARAQRRDRARARNPAMNRAARSMRSGSSENETSGDSGVRSTLVDQQVVDAAERIDERRLVGR